MSFSPDIDPNGGWAAIEPPPPRDPIADAIEKEKLIKEITAAQDDLRVILSKIQTTEADVDKLAAGNQTLQMYIDNLTKQIAARR